MRKGSFYDLSDYMIGEDGKIVNIHNNHIVKPQMNGKGYMRVSIGGRLEFVHRLVAQTFLPNPENKPQVNHKDGNKTNNCVSNLEWVTNQENRDHAVVHGLHLKGEACSNAKLTGEDVKYIRDHMDIPNNELAKRFGVRTQIIYSVKMNKTYID